MCFQCKHALEAHVRLRTETLYVQVIEEQIACSNCDVEAFASNCLARKRPNRHQRGKTSKVASLTKMLHSLGAKCLVHQNLNLTRDAWLGKFGNDLNHQPSGAWLGKNIDRLDLEHGSSEPFLPEKDAQSVDGRGVGRGSRKTGLERWMRSSPPPPPPPPALQTLTMTTTMTLTAMRKTSRFGLRVIDWIG